MLMNWKWHFENGYARRKDYIGCISSKPTWKMFGMHRVVMKAPLGMQVDHINHNKLDNQKCNLRLATHQENMWNSKIQKNNKSGYKGVSWRKQCNKWQATIKKNYKDISLGYYKTKEDAALAYNNAARELFGQFAFLNVV
jgi:hypothetical protein